VVVVAAVAGLGLLALGVVRNGTGGDGVQQSFTSPTPIHEGGPGGSVWEPTGDYQADHDGISLTILWFVIQTNVLVEYSLSHTDLSTTVAPGDLRLADDSGAVYAVRHNAIQGQALGVTVWQTSFDRPPDAGETLSFALTNPLVKGAQGENSVPGS
jgi:hypothetical protein